MGAVVIGIEAMSAEWWRCRYPGTGLPPTQSMGALDHSERSGWAKVRAILAVTVGG